MASRGRPRLAPVLLTRPLSTGSARARAFVAAHPDLAAIVLIAVVGCAVRLAFTFRVPVFLLRDSGSYFQPAHDLVYGLGFDLSIRRTPVYPWFLAGTIAVFGEELPAVALVQHALGVVSAALVYLLGRLTFGRVAGLLAGLLTALDGTLLVSEQYVMPEALLLLLFLATLIVGVGAIQRRSWWRFALCGLLLGLAVLCKPVSQVLLPIVPFVALISYRSWRRAVAPTVLLLAGVVIVLGPWMIRNLVVHGSLTTAGALGQTLVARTAKHDYGFQYYDQRREAEYADRREIVARQTVQSGIRQRLSDGVIYRRVQERLDLSDAEVNAYMRDLALDVIADRPLYYLQGTARMSWQLLVGEEEKLRTDWKTQNARLSRDEWDERIEHLLSRPTPIHHNEFERAAAVVDLYQPANLGPTLPVLGVVGLLLAAARPARRHATLPMLVALAVVVISAALDGPVARYRYPVDPLIALSAAGAVTWIVGWLVVTARRPARDHRLTAPTGGSGWFGRLGIPGREARP